MTTPSDRILARTLAFAIAALAAISASPASAQTITISEGTALADPADVCPRADGVAIAAATRTPVNTFKLSADVPLKVRGIQVRLSPTNAYQVIERIEFQNAAGTATFASKVPGTGGLENLYVLDPNLPDLLIGTTAKDYRIVVVPKTASEMPPPVSGGRVLVQAFVQNVSAVEGAYVGARGDLASATVAIDNESPANVAWDGITRAATSITLDWTGTPTAVVMRRLAGPVPIAPVENSSPAVSTVTPFDAASGTFVTYNGSGAVTFTDSGLTSGKPYYFRVFQKDTCGNYSTGVDLGPLYPGTITEGDTTANSAKPVVGIITPVSGAAASQTATGGPGVRVQVRVFSPNGVAISSVKVFADNGTAVPTEYVLTRNNAYGTATNSGVFEYQVAPGGLPLATGAWTLRAWAQNALACAPLPDCAAVYSGPVGITVNAKGDGRILVRDNSDQLCADCHATKTHSSEAVGAGLGSWFVGCRTCHQPHGSTNASLIANEVQPPANAQTLPPAKVEYFGPGMQTTPDGKGLCQTCHTQTVFFKRNVLNETHGDGQDCATCHAHQQGQKTQCTTCHGSTTRVPIAGADTLVMAAPPLSANSNTALRSDTTHYSVGDHEAHVNGKSGASTYTSVPILCDECHYNVSHNNMVAGGGGNANMGWGLTANANGASPLWNRGTGECSGVYCHGATLRGGADTSPSWVSGQVVNCSTCHASPPTLASTGHPLTTNCAACHGTNYTAAAVNKPTHIDRILQAPPSECARCHGDIGVANVNLTINLNYAAPGVGTAATTYDLGALAGNTRAGTGAHAKHLNSNWSTSGGSASCGQCHSLPPGNLDRTHATGGGVNVNDAATTSTGSRASLVWGFIAKGKAGAWNTTGVPESPSTFTPPNPVYSGSNTNTAGTAAGTAGTCSGTYCHGNFKNSGKTNVTLTWNSTTAMHCNSCHGTGATAGNATAPPMVSAGGTHPNITTESCGACHAGYSLIAVDPATHIDGVLQATVATASNCNGCHGDAARTTTYTTLTSYSDQLGRVSPPQDARSPNGVTEQTVYVGAHQQHVNQTATAAPPSGGAAGAYSAVMLCDACHVSVPTILSHGNGNPDMRVNTANRTTGMGQGSSYTLASAPSTQGGCVNTYCHGNWTYGNGVGRTIQWGTGAFSSATKLQCSSCHGVVGTTSLPAYPHPQNTSCVTCHGTNYSATSVNVPTHVNRATNKVGGQCSACHGPVTATTVYAANPVNAAPGIVAGSVDSRGNPDTSTSIGGIGAHKAHLQKTNFSDTAIACNQCHAVPTATQYPLADGGTAIGHSTGAGDGGARASFTWGTLATGAVSPWSGTITPTYAGSASGTTANGTGGTCTNYCHGNFRNGKNASFSWSGTFSATLTATTLTCTSCHGQGTTTPLPAHPHPQNVTCANCHGTGYNATTVVKANHVKGSLTQTSYGCTQCHGVLTTVSPGVLYSAPTNAAPGVSGGVDTTGAASLKAVGAHAAHLTGTNLRTAPVACTECHTGNGALAGTDTTAAHGIDVGTGGARANVSFGTFTTSDHRPTAGTIPSVAYAGSNTGTTDTAAGTCSNTYCHGASSPKAAAYQLLNGGTLKNPGWNAGSAARACTACHGAAPTLKADGTAHSSSTSCAGCHGTGYDTTGITGAALATHINGSIETGSIDGNPDCSACHLGGADVANYVYNDGTTATINSSEWTAVGHGSTSTTGNSFAEWSAAGVTNRCVYCHDSTINHGTAGNPFRLRGASTSTSGVTGAYTTTTSATTNSVCTNCHGTGTIYGVDPDAAGTQPRIAAATAKVSAYHAGADHTTTGRTGGNRCWDCHDPHGDGANVKMVAANPLPAPTDVHGYAGTRTSGVVFANNTAATDYVKAAAPYGICQTCHTGTTYWTSTGGGNTHNASLDCGNCHGHAGSAQNLAFEGLGSCTDCHTAAGDVANYVYNDGTKAMVNTSEWTGFGHGSTSTAGNSFAEFSAAGVTDRCVYCHDSTVAHGAGTNPFRLRGASTAAGGATGAYTTTSSATTNSVCTNCHGTGTIYGVDPDAGGTQPLIAGATAKVSSYHAGADHTTTGRTGGNRCWDCHDPHGDGTNIKMVASNPLPAPTDVHGYAGTRASGVVFTGNTTAGDYVKAAAPYGVCQTCHTGTTYWTSTGGGNTHNATTVCNSCHLHTGGAQNLAFEGGGSCSACHLKTTGDVANYAYGDATTATINQTEWTGYGHGQGGGGYTEFTGVTDRCIYCHDSQNASANHGQAANPFRLRGASTATGGATGLYSSATPASNNAVCLNCHGTGTIYGVDPDGAGTAALIAGATTRVGTYHYGPKHSTTVGQRCWDCHDVHGDLTNLKNVAGNPLITSTDVYGYAGTRASGVVFAGLTAATDYAKAAAPYGVCQVCHTATIWWKADGTGRGHNPTTDCSTCHVHGTTAALAFNATGAANCAQCHQTAAADVPNYVWNDNTMATINGTEWTGSGHGSTATTGNSYAEFSAAGVSNRCLYCHDDTVGHAVTGNPFRLRGASTSTSGATGAYTTTTSATLNSVCTNCHGTGTIYGVDPDAAGTQPRITSATAKVDAYHAGADHTTTGRTGGNRCWDCHDVHGDGNIKAIAKNPTPAPTDVHGYVGTRASGVVFTNNIAATDYVKTTTPFAGVCQVCHTGTTYWTASGTGMTHNQTTACKSCHLHQVPPNLAFKGPATCIGCHGERRGAIPRAAVVNVAAGQEGDDFVRRSRHVSNGTTTSIVTDYDCILCHAEGSLTSSGSGATMNIVTTTNHGGDTGGSKLIELRNVDSTNGAGISVAWPGARLNSTAPYQANTAQRNAMDEFCMACHDANGASQVAVNKTNPASGMLYSNTTVPTLAQAQKPFNVNDNLRNGFEVAALATWRSTTNGKVIDVKAQFNTGNAVGRNFASHHNLNAYTKRYAANNNTNLRFATFTTYQTKENAASAIALNANNANAGTRAGLHCSDCHLNEANAHGSRNTMYMMSDKNGTDTAFVSSGTTSSTDVCMKCHAPTEYGENSTGTNSRTTVHQGDCTREDGGAVYSNNGAYLARNNVTLSQDISCLLCHGGSAPGIIHGTNGTYNPWQGATASKMYRFMGTGGSYRFYSPAGQVGVTAGTADTAWEGTTATGCYTLGAADTFGGCTGHTSGRAGSTSRYARPLD